MPETSSSCLNSRIRDISNEKSDVSRVASKTSECYDRCGVRPYRYNHGGWVASNAEVSYPERYADGVDETATGTGYNQGVVANSIGTTGHCRAPRSSAYTSGRKSPTGQP